MTKELLLVVGVGPATGTTLCRRLDGKYRILMVARSADRIAALEEELSDAHAYVCDISDRVIWDRTLQQIRDEHGTPRRILLNTESATWGEYNELSLERFSSSFDVNAVAVLQMVQTLFPDKHAIADDSRIVISSSPAAYSPPANFLGLAPSRVAQRVLVELLNENLSTCGLRFSVFSIDGAIDEPKMRAMLADKPTSYFIQTEDIAAQIESLLDNWDFPLHSTITGESSFSQQ